MEIELYFNEKRKLYENLLNFVENADLISEKYFNELIEIIQSQEINHFLQLISSISNNHQRGELFFQKIEQILLYFSNEIKQIFSNDEIFNIFINNKRILLFLFNKGIIVFDEYIKEVIVNRMELNGIKYCHFFLPEMKSLLNENEFQEIENQLTDDDKNNYEEKRLNGNNDTYISQLIRNDSVEEFISFMTRSNLSFSMTIQRSIFETNPLLNEEDLTLIEYAAFFGSIQIFNFLQLNGVELAPKLWIYVIHSKNAEMIHLLESLRVPPPEDSYELCLIESIKCHHNDFAKYIEDSLIDEKSKSANYKEKIIDASFKHYNYGYFPDKMEGSIVFFYLSLYNYINIVNLWIENRKEEIESIIMNNQKKFIKFKQ